MAGEYIIGSDAQFNENVDVLGKLNLFDSINQVEKFVLNLDSKEKLRITPDGVTFTDTLTAPSGKFLGNVTATKFQNADGSSLTAAAGGDPTNPVFFENAKRITFGYQISSGKNAMSAGPIEVAAGVAVTVPSGSSWTIV
tara:strand:+ start:5370 stop:5789 length:420 start_codon:yes stop_codon:yes gene_type:complete